MDIQIASGCCKEGGSEHWAACGFLLQYSCFTMLCWLLLTAKWISYKYTYTLSFLDFFAI